MVLGMLMLLLACTRPERVPSDADTSAPADSDAPTPIEPGCGGEDACEIADGKYLAWAPSDADGPLPVLIFVHGYGGVPLSISNDTEEVAAMNDLGVLLILPASDGNSWNEDRGSDRRDDYAFIESVIDDAETRWGLDPDRVFVGGFSTGGSMASMLACYLPERFAGAVTMSGTFWEPMPTDCAAPIPLQHTHGTTDTTWPLEGRSFGSAAQGAVADGVAVWRTLNGCSEESTITKDGPLLCEEWSGCEAPTRLCMHDYAHQRVDGWGARQAGWLLSVSE
ncbi:MAG: polyhydroxybutyrate depolymerase [Myxococcota bacterium]|jgi:polyhydroxybutyrate depolymerase